MGLEAASTFDALNKDWPLGTDPKSQGDDHIRQLKLTIQAALGDDGTKVTIKRPATIAGALTADSLVVKGTGTTPADLTITSVNGRANFSAIPVTFGSSVRLNGRSIENTNIDPVFWKKTGGVGFTFYRSSDGTGTGTGATLLGNISEAGEIIAPTRLISPTHVIGASAASTFYLAEIAGPSRIVNFGASYFLQWNTANGDFSWVTAAGTAWSVRATDRSLLLYGAQAFKPGGGPWVDISDARVKTDIADYATGADAILNLRPVTYRYKGNDVDAEGNGGHQDTEKTYIGLIAQEVETVMPEMVSQSSGWIDGAEVEDMRNLDTSALIFALVNTIKELHQRVGMLEARHG